MYRNLVLFFRTTAWSYRLYKIWIGYTLYIAVTVSMLSFNIQSRLQSFTRILTHTQTCTPHTHTHIIRVYIKALAGSRSLSFDWFTFNIIIMKNSTETHGILIHDMSFRIRSYFFFFVRFFFIFYFSSIFHCVIILFHWKCMSVSLSLCCVCVCARGLDESGRAIIFREVEFTALIYFMVRLLFYA